MDDARLLEFVDRSMAEYIEKRVATGGDRQETETAAAVSRQTSFPGGVPAPGQRIYDVMDGAQVVGVLWIGPATSRGPGAAWVNYVEVYPAQRGKGLGRAIMELAEIDAADHGATALGLNVFGHNLVARRLYESLGYQPVSIQMTKRVGGA